MRSRRGASSTPPARSRKPTTRGPPRSGAEPAPALKVGANYLEACRDAIDIPADAARTVHASLEAVLRGQREEFALEYPSTRHGEDRWLEVRVRRPAPFGSARPSRRAPMGAVDIAARRVATLGAAIARQVIRGAPLPYFRRPRRRRPSGKAERHAGDGVADRLRPHPIRPWPREIRVAHPWERHIAGPVADDAVGRDDRPEVTRRVADGHRRRRRVVDLAVRHMVERRRRWIIV